MKKAHRNSIAVAVIAAIAVVAYLFNLPVLFIRYFLLYDHISYNGENYYLCEDIHAQPSNNYTEENLPVNLVDAKGKPYKRYIAYARGYDQDTDHEFLYFDSAVYTKNPDLISAP